MTSLFEPDASGFFDMGDVQHWFGLLPEGCEDRTWLPYLEASAIGMNPKRKITVPLPLRSLATPFAA